MPLLRAVALALLVSTFSQAAVPPLKRVFVVILENTDYKQAIKQPFLKKLSDEGANLTQMYALTHPSQPNYLGLVAGDTLNVSDDGNHDVTATHIGNLIEKKGMHWKVYAEGWPGNCFLGAKSGDYVRKHNPFISFTDVQKNRGRCDRIVDASELEKDVEHKQLPELAFYIPDQLNDGHDTGVAYADKAMKNRFEKLLSDPGFIDDTTFVMTFDENGTWWIAPNRIYTSFFGYGVKTGASSATRYTLYSLLRTIEDGLGLGTLGRHDAKAIPISDIWK